MRVSSQCRTVRQCLLAGGVAEGFRRYTVEGERKTGGVRERGGKRERKSSPERSDCPSGRECNCYYNLGEHRSPQLAHKRGQSMVQGEVPNSMVTVVTSIFNMVNIGYPISIIKAQT